MPTIPAATSEARRRVPSSTVRAWVFGALALAWYALNTFASLPVPAFAVVWVLGVLVMLSLPPDSDSPGRGIAMSRRNAVLAVLGLAAFVPVAFGTDLLRGRIPIEWGSAVVGTFAALCVVIPRFAQTREYPRPAILGHRELTIVVTAVVTSARSWQAADVFVAMVAFAAVVPFVMGFRRIRYGCRSPFQLSRTHAAQAANLWLFLALVAAVGFSGTLAIWHVLTPGAASSVVGVFGAGLLAAAVLAAFPRPRISVATNLVIVLGSLFLAAQLVRIHGSPAEAVRIGVPFTEDWTVASGGRSTFVNNHAPIGVQRDAIDFVQVVDGTTYRDDRSRLENFHIYGKPLLAVADARVTAAVGSRPDLPVGGRTWEGMEGNYVILDIGAGRYVLYGHLMQGSLRVQVGDVVRRGQVIAQVGDSGNSDEPHLHLQVQNTPTFDVESRAIRTYPILFDDTTVSDVRRGDVVRPKLAALLAMVKSTVSDNRARQGGAVGDL